MKDYIARVQFSKEDMNWYTILRDNLIKIGFTKRIKNNLGIEYRLPNGNYFIRSEKEISTIIDSVSNIAKQIDKNPTVLVTEVSNMSWIGLQKC